MGTSVCLTVGTFDRLHYGHVRLFRRAAAFGRLTVGVNTDRFVATYKQAAVQPEAVRHAAVLRIACVADALLNDGPGIDLIEWVRPRLLVVGSDWHECGYLAQIGATQERLDEICCGVLYLPRTPGVSSTQLRSAA